MTIFRSAWSARTLVVLRNHQNSAEEREGLEGETGLAKLLVHTGPSFEATQPPPYFKVTSRLPSLFAIALDRTLGID